MKSTDLKILHYFHLYNRIRKVSSAKSAVLYSLQVGDGGSYTVGINKHFLLILFFFTSIVSDRNNKRMPLGDDCHAWKKKTTDVKDQYDFKEVLGT